MYKYTFCILKTVRNCSVYLLASTSDLFQPVCAIQNKSKNSFFVFQETKLTSFLKITQTSDT